MKVTELGYFYLTGLQATHVAFGGQLVPEDTVLVTPGLYPGSGRAFCDITKGTSRLV